MAQILRYIVVGALVAAAPAMSQSVGPEAQRLGSRSPVGAGDMSATAPVSQLASTLPALVAVIGLVVICFVGYRWIASRMGGLPGQLAGAGAPQGVLDLLGRYPIGRGQSMLLVKVDRRILLVSQTMGSRVGSVPALRTLCEITDPDEVAAIISKSSERGSDHASGLPDFRSLFESSKRWAGGGVSVPKGDTPGDIEVVDLTNSGRMPSVLSRLARRDVS